MPESFYCTLKSKAHQDIFPNNSPNNFCDLWLKQKSMHGDWEVALASFYYPIAFPQVEYPPQTPLHKIDKSAGVVVYDEENNKVVAKKYPEMIHIFCDVVELSDVGNMHGPYLSEVRVLKASNETLEGGDKVKFHYHNVVKQHIDKIRVYLLDEKGAPVSFVGGEVTVKLHFRKIR